MRSLFAPRASTAEVPHFLEISFALAEVEMQQSKRVCYHVLLHGVVKVRFKAKAWRRVHFEQPGLKSFVDQEVKTQDLKAHRTRQTRRLAVVVEVA